jgi:glycerol-3-phosphate cytidylyltransferase
MSNIVYNGGTYDLFHSGHVNILRRCREIAGPDGKVVIALNTDDFVYQFKNKRPICNDQERMDVLLACKYVDEVIMNVGGQDSKITIDLVKPNYIVAGSDWAKKDYHAQMSFTQEWLDERGIGLVYVPYTQAISSTQIRSRMK